MDWLNLTSGLSITNLILAAISVGWLLWRVHKVLETPVDDLVRLLGIEVPAAPIVTLLDISPNSVSLHLKNTDQRNLAVKYTVRVNGAIAGEVSGQDNAISVQDLQPGHYYIIRIIAVNASNFQASSESIRVRTNEQNLNDITHHANLGGGKKTPSPSVIPYKGFAEAPIISSAAPVMTREHSGGIAQPRRSNTARRGSPATHHESSTPPLEINGGHGDGVDTVLELTAKLDSIRREIEELERQDEEEEKEFQSTQASLVEKRENLRQQLKERDDESNDLKKTVTSLERQNTAAQTRKAKQEKLLGQKMGEREKLRDDMRRWERETSEFGYEAEQLIKQKAEYLATASNSIQTLRQEQDADHQAIKAIEERIRETGTQIKELEEEKKMLEEPPNEAGLSERQRQASQEDYEWNERLTTLQNRVQSAWVNNNQAQLSLHQTQQRLYEISGRHGSQANSYPGPFIPQTRSQVQALTGDTQPGHPSSNSSARNTIVDTESPRLTSLHTRSAPSATISFQTPSPFFSSANLSVPNANPVEEGMSEAEIESLTGGALVSPTAGALLPAGLLGDDSEDIPHNNASTSQAPYLPGLGAIPEPSNGEAGDETRQDLASPLSFDSRSPSSISSPHGSISNLHHHKLSEGRIDSDRRSTRSTSSSSRVAPTKRFGELFGLQRSRATSNEGLPLGSLKTFQSRSMPRQNEDVGHSSAAQQRRGMSSSGLFGSMSYALGRRGPTTSKVAEEGDSELGSQSTGRGVAFGLFGSGRTPWAQSSSTRPSSTYSTENVLPRPSVDSQPFGWATNDTHDATVSTRPGSINNPWSSFPSRRPSVAQEPLPSLLHNVSHLDADTQELGEEEQSPVQAPIGTKPSKLKKDSPQKQLNPAARDFKSIIRGGQTKQERRAEKARKGEKTPNGEDYGTLFADTPSPPESRKSREQRISSAADSSEELSEDHTGSPSKQADAISQPGSATKESFLRKMTRKGSSSKFSLSSSLLFSRKGAQSDEVVEEDLTETSLGRSVESVVSSQQGTGDKRSSGFSLPSFKRRAKKGTEAPSISEASMASETGDEAEERPSVDTDD